MYISIFVVPQGVYKYYKLSEVFLRTLKTTQSVDRRHDTRRTTEWHHRGLEGKGTNEPTVKRSHQSRSGVGRTREEGTFSQGPTKVTRNNSTAGIQSPSLTSPLFFSFPLEGRRTDSPRRSPPKTVSVLHSPPGRRIVDKYSDSIPLHTDRPSSLPPTAWLDRGINRNTVCASGWHSWVRHTSVDQFRRRRSATLSCNCKELP